MGVGKRTVIGLVVILLCCIASGIPDSVSGANVKDVFAIGIQDCMPEWRCTAWSLCSSDRETRICEDLNRCGGVEPPPTLRSCGVGEPDVDPLSSPFAFSTRENAWFQPVPRLDDADPGLSVGGVSELRDDEPDGSDESFFILGDPSCSNGVQDGDEYGVDCGGSCPVECDAIFVDQAPGQDCAGSYSIAARDCSGSDGDSYNTIGEAVSSISPGVIIQVRDGLYTLSTPLHLAGSEIERKVLMSYPGESPHIHYDSVIKEPIIQLESSMWTVDGFEITGYIEPAILDNWGVRSDQLLRNLYIHSPSSIAPDPGYGKDGIRLVESWRAIIENVVIDGGGIGRHGIGIDRGCPNVTVRNVIISNMEQAGIETTPTGEVTGLFIKNVTIHDTGEGLDLTNAGPYNITVEDATIYTIGYDYGAGAGFKMWSGPFYVRGLVLYDCPLGAMTLNVRHGDNDIGVPGEAHISHSTIVGGKINMWLASNQGGEEGSTMYFDSIVSAFPDNYAIYGPENEHRALTTSPQACPSPTAECVYVDEGNNILFRELDPVIHWNDGLHYTNAEVNDGSVPLLDGSTFSADPGFVDLGLNDYHLTSGSAAIDAGSFIAGYHCESAGSHPGEDCKEWYGAAPDVGAFEYLSAEDGNCNNGIQDGDEEGIDCGGSCPISCDTDGDGLPDSWELDHFDAITSYDAEDDPDGDRLVNLEEYYADSDPLDADSDDDARSDGVDSFPLDPYDEYGPAFHIRLSDGNHVYYLNSAGNPGPVRTYHDSYIDATVEQVGEYEWSLTLQNIHPSLTITGVDFPFEYYKYMLDSVTEDDTLYDTYLFGTARLMTTFDVTTWGWSGLVYPNVTYAPLHVVADDTKAKLVAAANWPPRTVKPMACFKRSRLLYEDAVLPGESETYNAFIAEVAGNAEQGIKPWHAALDVYDAWLRDHMSSEGLLPIEYPDSLKSANGWLAIHLQNRPAFTTTEIDSHWQSSKDYLPWLQFWGQMSNYGQVEPVNFLDYVPWNGITPPADDYEGTPPLEVGEWLGCCFGERTLHPRYADLPAYIDAIKAQGATVGFYSRPLNHYSWGEYHELTDTTEYDDWDAESETPLEYLIGWIAVHTANGANAYYLDVLGARNFGPPLDIANIIKAQLPGMSVLEFAKDVYPAAFLISGNIRGGSIAMEEGHTVENSDRITVADFGRYLLGDRILFYGYQNGEYDLYGAAHNHFAERQAFLLGAKFDSPGVAYGGVTNEFLINAIELRTAHNWWAREPIYRSTRGITSIPDGVEVRRFIANDGVTLFAIDNPFEQNGLTFGWNGETVSIPMDALSIVERECAPDWQMGEWSSCSEGARTREVFDENDCGTTTGMPVSVVPCDEILSGMEIVSVVGDTGEITIETTGATYVLTSTDLEMWRKIDPSTNGINPRLVARLDFTAPLGDPSITDWNSSEASVHTNLADFRFFSDSFFSITALNVMGYTHTNLIEDTTWRREDDNLNRMWTDGLGGSLHAKFSSGAPLVLGQTSDFTTFGFFPGMSMGHMVFPPKPFDFDGLYGEDTKPFVYFAYAPDGLERIVDNMQSYRDEGFGAVLLFSTFYNRPGPISHLPAIMDSGVSPWIAREGLYGYEYADPAAVKAFIATAHENGLKVLTYFGAPGFDPDGNGFPGYPATGQSLADTFYVMEQFREEYDLDGWYFDNAGINFGNLADNYEFIKTVRRELGDEGIIIHHESVDVWDTYPEYNGLKAVMIDAYVDYALVGETGDMAMVDSPNDPYVRYFTSGYGLSQVYGSEILPENRSLAISRQELHRVLGENLYGWVYSVDKTYATWAWYKPFYDVVKARYAAGEITADPYVDWEAPWFRLPDNVAVIHINSTAVNISWTTADPSTSEVAYTSNGYWWESPNPERYPDGPDGIVASSELVTSHRLLLDNLTEYTDYEFRIRSSNGAELEHEVIWGVVDNFTTLEGLSSREPSCAQVPSEKVFIWMHRWGEDTSIFPSLKASGLVTHVYISNLDYNEQPTSEPNTHIIQEVRDAGLIPIWGRDLWFQDGNVSAQPFAQPFKDEYTDGSIVHDAEYYEWFLRRLREEANELGVPLTGLDAEDYAPDSRSKVGYTIWNADDEIYDSVHSAIAGALATRGVRTASFYLPAMNTSVYYPHLLYQEFNQLGKNLITEDTYFDCTSRLGPFLTSGFEVAGIWGTTDPDCYRVDRISSDCMLGDTEGETYCEYTDFDHDGTGPAIWTAQTLFDNVDYWFNANHGIFVYTDESNEFAMSLSEYCILHTDLCDQYSYQGLYQESCNSIDDDCDGNIDEGFGSCDTGSPGGGSPGGGSGGRSGGAAMGWVPPTPTIAPCVFNWTCSEWSECVNGTRIRNCTEMNHCEPGSDEEFHHENCTEEQLQDSCGNGLLDEGETTIDCGGPCEPCEESPRTVELAKVPDVVRDHTPLLLMASAFGIIIISSITLLIVRSHQFDPLHKFLQQQRKIGISEMKIREQLKKAGWTDEQLDKHMKPSS